MRLYTAEDMATLWGISVQMVRRYCREGKVPGAKQTEQGWMIPEGTPKPGTELVRETSLSPLMKKIQYQRQRNNHFGIYEYIQVNLAYSSNRMASNRLTRNEVLEVYRTSKISTSFEPVKVDDIIETINHFSAGRYVVDNVSVPLTQSFIKNLHGTLTYGTYADRKEKLHPGEFRHSETKIGVQHKEIAPTLSSLLKEYERDKVNMERILDFHARFEQIRPFEDYNGRVGRLIMMKECLRHDVGPFIIDDKRRGAYHRGIAAWVNDHKELTSVAHEAQKRFQGKMEVCRLMEYCRAPRE